MLVKRPGGVLPTLSGVDPVVPGVRHGWLADQTAFTSARTGTTPAAFRDGTP